jgi:tRNA nucleotidyltransferase/poly(A) polymerase
MMTEAPVEARVMDWLVQQNVAAYLVGGCVRDRLLGRPTYDLDLAVAGDGLGLARRLANRFDGAYYALDAERGTGRAILPTRGEGRLVVDVARLRGPDLATDLNERDFTINALAADVRTPDQVIDLHGGLADLAQGFIRPVGEKSIRSDPLRALRAVRQAAELGFVLSPETKALVRRDGPGLTGVASERRRDELARLLVLSNAAPFLDQLDDLGLLTIVLPELEPLRGLEQSPPHCLDVLSHSLEAVRALETLIEELTSDTEQTTGNKVHRPRKASGLEALIPFAGRVERHLSQNLGDERPRLVTLKMAALLHDTGKAEARTLGEDESAPLVTRAWALGQPPRPCDDYGSTGPRCDWGPPSFATTCAPCS